MHVQVNSHHIPGSVALHEWVGAAVEDRLERFDDFLTRIEVHLSDENAQKAGADDKTARSRRDPRVIRPFPSRTRPSRCSWRWKAPRRRCITRWTI